MILLGATDWEFFFFLLFALVACVFALGVLFSSNVVRMAFYLVLSLGATAGLFILAGAEFVGAMQLMIYVGGTLVLLIFGVMLTAQSRFVEMKTRGSDWVLAIGVGGALFLLLANSALSVPGWLKPNDKVAELQIDDSKNASQLGTALVGVRVDRLERSQDDIIARGYSGYLLPFVIVSVHLLVVLIGAAYMARTKKMAAAQVAEVTGTATGDQVVRSRGFVFIAVSVLGMAFNVLLGMMHILAQTAWRERLTALFDFVGGESFFANNFQDFFEKYVDVWVVRSPSLLLWLGILFFCNVAFIFITLNWQRWSVYALCLSPLLQLFMILTAGVSAEGLLGALLIPGFLATTIGPVVVYIAILRQGGDQSIWSQLE